MYLCRFFCPNSTQDSITWVYEDAVTHEIHMARQARDPFFTFTMGDNKTPDKNRVFGTRVKLCPNLGALISTCVIRYQVVYHSSKHLVRGLRL